MSPGQQTAILAAFDRAALAMQKTTLDLADIEAARVLFLHYGGTMRDLVMTRDGGLVKRMQAAIAEVRPPQRLSWEKAEVYKAGAVAVIQAINPVLRECAAPQPAAAAILAALERASGDALDPLLANSMPTSLQAFFTLHGDVLRDLLANWRPTQALAAPSPLESGCVGIALHTMREARAFVTGNAAAHIDAAIAQIERLAGEGGAG